MTLKWKITQGFNMAEDSCPKMINCSSTLVAIKFLMWLLREDFAYQRDRVPGKILLLIPTF